MLEAANINKSFDGTQVLNNISLEVDTGKILCIVGPSGAGKTTLLRIITGLEKADTGQFKIDGKAFDPESNTTNEAMIGVVFQDFRLFPHLNVLENITLAPQLALHQSKAEANAKAKEILTQLGLEDKADIYPFQLSGGQKQRVAIARALALNPKILCYDEPTSALDPGLRESVAQLIERLKAQGMTQIVVTHDMEFAQNIADKILTVKPNREA
ncbi:ectoine hydroxyectoine ABC transporter, ATP-binding protein [Agrilactobacillus composti DSM 18527 = JCM 14202]|uniref:Ectoine hydroxyectoine ABC transporter, ATP-binding protein n=1 Tax=Agrilactobacillus composti DSM 18527 = JCM 14202 TaxID=1423734 RepID=X0QPP9_9LACO|nr:amino acid ABC transporter ATP-binding protein [Agrilactobacillus composti]KRM36659.1 ectoine hydroxyectoine ABC transporter, ATP-binding protein [Agrilactobacillus composti DSM 18527 = JCM 14202]GAF40585.1 amino acid ABC transporter, ATP-binding protein [Agrilactobacillus composti DSM 18527 = JCM 14202]